MHIIIKISIIVPDTTVHIWKIENSIEHRINVLIVYSYLVTMKTGVIEFYGREMD